MNIPPGKYRNIKDVQRLPNGAYVIILQNDLVILAKSSLNLEIGKVRSVTVHVPDKDGNSVLSVQGYFGRNWIFEDHKAMLTKGDYVEELI